jgi:hypothetical protein
MIPRIIIVESMGIVEVCNDFVNLEALLDFGFRFPPLAAEVNLLSHSFNHVWRVQNPNSKTLQSRQTFFLCTPPISSTFLPRF